MRLRLRLLERWGLSRTISVAIVTGFTCICLAVGAYVLTRQVLSVVQTLPGYRANIQRKMGTLHSSSEHSVEATIAMIEDLSKNLTPGDKSADDAVRVQVVGQKSDQLQANLHLIGSVLEPIGQFAIVIVFCMYMLLNREELRHRLLMLAGMGNINVMTQALGDASARISQYLVMQLQVNACYGIVFGIGLYFLHVPEATLWGVISGTLRMVPFVGTLIGMVFPLMLSVAVSSSWWNPLLVLGLFLVIESTVANLVEPWLFSSKTGISSLALLTSAIFWSMIWGWPGLVLSTPLTVCVVVLGQHIPQLAFLHSLLGTNATLSPAAHVYERLLAMDQAEASEVAESYLKGKPLAQLYDAVILPVLSLAEEDRHKGVLTDVRWQYLLLSIGDLIARLNEYPPDQSLAAGIALPIEIRGPQPQKEFAIVCISSGDQANELAALMLSQLLERNGRQTITLSAESVSDQVLRGLSAEKDTVLLLSALPPFAFAQTRALCQRVRANMPENRIVIALWNSPEDADELLTRFGAARPEVVVSTLGGAVMQIENWRAPRKF